MLLKLRSVSVAVVLLVLGLCALSTGCDQARRGFADALSPTSAEDTLKKVRQHIADGNFKAARDAGETFLSSRSDDTGVLAWELAKACVQLGDNEHGIRYVEHAMRARVVSGIDLMSEPMLEPIRSDPRLAAFASGMAPSPAASALR